MFRRVPWLDVKVQDSPAGDGAIEAVVACNRCAATVTVPIDSEERYLEATRAALEHRQGCPVPAALLRARTAHLN